jgi:hypothetical protein
MVRRYRVCVGLGTGLPRGIAAGGDLLGRRQIIFHQYGWNGKRILNIVETKSGIVGWEIGCRFELHSQQIANLVVVFGAIQPVRG